METKNKPTTSGKSKPKPSPSKPSSSKTKSSSNSRPSSGGGSNANQSKVFNRDKPNNSAPDSKKYKQKPDYKNNRHNSHTSPANNKKKNYNPKFDSSRHRPNRNSRWHPTENRYGNLTWQRPHSNPSNDSFRNRGSDYRSQEREPFRKSNSNSRDIGRNQNPFQAPYQNADFLRNFQEGLVNQIQSFLERSLDSQNTSKENEHQNKEQTKTTQGEPNLEKPANTKEKTNVEPTQPIVETVVEKEQTKKTQKEPNLEKPANTKENTNVEPPQPIVENLAEEFQEPLLPNFTQNCDVVPLAENFFSHEAFETVNSDFGIPEPLNQSQDFAHDPLDALNHLQQLKQLKSEPFDLSDECHFVNVKTELPDSDFNLDSCIDSDSTCPQISVIPISRLIKSELEDLNRVEIVAPTTPAKGKPTLKPNLVQRKKKSNKDSTLSENLVQRVANMDKVGIKNVINNSGTKYDAALKIQARKKLREEIRKQLKSMNFTPQENSGNSVIIPDEIVDSMHIPAVVLDEIRKAFGIVLLENLESKTIKTAEESLKLIDPVLTSPTTVALPGEQQPKSPPPDLMTKLKMVNDTKSQSGRVSPHIIKVDNSQRNSNSIETIVVIDSSSSSSDNSSSSSDSDSSSSSSGSDCSTSSSFKRRRRKKRILEANVVGNFEKLILPNLTKAQRQRYKDKYSKTTKNSLLYIHNVCVDRANRHNKSIDRQEMLRVRKNLSSADNAQSLEFLMKAILKLFEKQRENRQKSKLKSNAFENSQISNPVKDVTSKSKDSTCNSVNEEPKEQQNETAKSAEQRKHKSTKVDESTTPNTEGGDVDGKSKDSISESACSAQGVSPSSKKLVASESHTDSESVNDNEYPPLRPWKSPGEKKCTEIEIASTLSSLGMMQPPTNTFSFDIDSLKSQSAIGDEAVNSIREIDVKLMELHKRRMYIEEMVLKLQKDKMEVEFLTMKLQNEKFTILNSALANASTSVVSTSKSVATKRKSESSSSQDKHRSRKKYCDRDKVDEETGSGSKSSQSRRSSDKSSSRSDKTKSSSRTDKKYDDHSSKKSSESKSSSRSDKTSSSIKSEKKTEEDSSKESSKVKPEDANKQKNSSKEPVEVVYDEATKPTETEKEVNTVKLPEVDYSNVPNGSLDGWKLPITQIIVIGEAIIAASEDGNIYKFNIRTRVLESKFSKHTEAITQIFSCPKENFIYTTSLDGFMKKTSMENFGLEIQSLNLQEPLQSVDIEWNTAFVGSRWGNIFTYDIKNNNLSESLLCSSGSSIIAIKATKEGPRKILIVSSKGNQISFRDAMTGLLLRSLDIPDGMHIYSILLDDACLFCGTQRNEIYQFNFTTGARLAIFHCGNGAVSMKLYRERYIFVGCYDGFVYVLDKQTGCQIGRFPGAGKMILALDIAGDKLITSAKDNTMQITDIPKYIVTKAKS